MHTLSNLSRPLSHRKARRVGRGGRRGKTSGRGGKGQTARAGAKLRPEWRDIIKKIPKRRGYGVNRSRTVRPRVPTQALTFDALQKHFKPGDTVTVRLLVARGLVRRVSGNIPPLKVLARGTLTSAFSFQKGIEFSADAREKILAAGGTIL